MTRSEILEAAHKCVCGDREQDYGRPEDNFRTIGLLWTTYLQAAHPGMAVESITAKDVAVMMALLKVARIATGGSMDSYVDLAGYAACAGEVASRGAKAPATHGAVKEAQGIDAVPAYLVAGANRQN